MNPILDITFDTIMSYNDWVIFIYKDKYYVADEEKGIFQVDLKYKESMMKFKDGDAVDFDSDYSGESDDGDWDLGFNRIK